MRLAGRLASLALVAVLAVTLVGAVDEGDTLLALAAGVVLALFLAVLSLERRAGR